MDREPQLNENGHLEEWISVIDQRWQNVPDIEVDLSKLQHIAITCDGNRRSAIEKDLRPQDGHRLGLEVIRGMAGAFRKWGIKTATFWLWSTENWSREQDQVDSLMSLAAENLKNNKIIEELINNKVKFTHIGRKDRVPAGVSQGLSDLEMATANYNDYRLNIAIDYGGLDEIATATQKIVQEVQEGKLEISTLTKNPEVIFNYLYTSDQPLPDLMLRTGMKEGELPRTSGLFPLQSAYACWQFVSDNFPDLEPETLKQRIVDYTKYTKRYGK